MRMRLLGPVCLGLVLPPGVSAAADVDRAATSTAVRDIGRQIDFLQELFKSGAVSITDTEREAVREEDSCPSCKQGVLVLRTGPYGEFRSCSNFPV